MIWWIRPSSVFLLLITVVPQFRTGLWMVRLWDFPRFQIGLALLLMLLFVGLVGWKKRDRRGELVTWSILLGLALLWQVSHLMPFTPLWSPEVPITDNVEHKVVRLMVVNLKLENKNYDQVAEQIEAESPDVLVLIETNQPWMEGLQALREQYCEHHEVVRGKGLGLTVWSRLPIKHVETRRLVSERRASIWAHLEWPNGAPIHFVAVHPTPPGLRDSTGTDRRNSRVRDAELVLVAKQVADHSQRHWIVAGDFNDVAWSHTTRLLQRISGLKDPRVGRNFLGTFHSQYPLLRAPIDHVFVSSGFSMDKMYRVKISGSDHFAVVTDLALVNPFAGTDPEPEADDVQDAQELVDEGQQDAEKRNVDKGADGGKE